MLLEQEFTGTIGAGASADLSGATKIAHALVSKYGMTDFGINRTFFNEVNSQQVMDSINKEIYSIIAKAMERAKQIISKNHVALERLVDALVTNGIVNENELKHICYDI